MEDPITLSFGKTPKSPIYLYIILFFCTHQVLFFYADILGKDFDYKKIYGKAETLTLDKDLLVNFQKP